MHFGFTHTQQHPQYLQVMQNHPNQQITICLFKFGPAFKCCFISHELRRTVNLPLSQQSLHVVQTPINKKKKLVTLTENPIIESYLIIVSFRQM